MDSHNFTDDLGYDDQAIRLAYHELFTDNGRVFLSAPQDSTELEEFAEEPTVAAADDNAEAQPAEKVEDITQMPQIKQNFGPRGERVRSKLDDTAYPAIVAVIAPATELVNGSAIQIPYHNAHPVDVVDINFPEMVLSPEQLSEYHDSRPQTAASGSYLHISKNPSSFATAAIVDMGQKLRELHSSSKDLSLALDKILADKTIRESLADETIREFPSHDASRTPPRPRSSSLTRVSNLPVDDPKTLLNTAADHWVHADRFDKTVRPTDKDIVAQWLLVSKLRPDIYKDFEEPTLLMFRSHLRFAKKMEISKGRVFRLLSPKFKVMSWGSLPMSKEDEVTESGRKALELELKTLLPKRAGKTHTPLDEEAIKEFRQQAHDLRKQQAYQDAPHHQNFEAILAARREYLRTFSQTDQGAKVSLYMRDDPNGPSYMRASFNFNVLDARTPEIQPVVHCEVNLTHENCRTDTGDCFYALNHQVLDVTHETFDADLKKLFRHLKDDFFVENRKFCHVNKRLVLVVLPYNGKQWNSNVRNLLPDMPADHKNLRVTQRHPGLFYLLLREDPREVADYLDSLANRFQERMSYNPNVRFFLDPKSQHITHKTIKPLGDLPRFYAPSEHTMPTFKETVHREAIGTLMEYRSQNPDLLERGYTGTIVLIPIPKSYSSHLKIATVYWGLITLDKESRKLPQPKVEDVLRLGLGNNLTELPQHPFRCKIAPPNVISTLDTISCVVERPLDLVGARSYDQTQLSDIPVSAARKMSAQDYHEHFSTADSRLVTLWPSIDHRQLKRCMRNYDLASFSLQESEADPMKTALLSDLQQLWTAQDFETLPRVPWSQVFHPRDRHRCMEYTRSRIDEEKIAVLDSLENDGIVAKLAIIAGISGSGKTHLAANMVAPMTLGVILPRDLSERQEEVRSTYIRTGKLDEAQKLSKEWPVIGSTDSWVNPARVRGRILAVAAQHTTVNKLADDLEVATNHCRNQHKLPPALCIRFNARQSELVAVASRATGAYDTPDHSPYLNDNGLDGEFSDVVAALYDKVYRVTDKKFMRDSRYSSKNSIALHIAQLAGLEPMSPALAAKVEGPLLAVVRHDLRGLVEASGNSELTLKALKDQIKDVTLRAMQLLIIEADIIACTPMAAVDPLVEALFHPHVVVVEEGSRIPSAQLIGLLSRHWGVQRFILLGDWRQLPPAVFGSKFENNYRSSIIKSKMFTWKNNGFPVQELFDTRRFGNSETIELCAIVNGVQLNLSESAGRPQQFLQAKTINHEIYSRLHAVLFVNMERSNVRRDQVQSAYNADIAIAIAHDLRTRAERISGKDIAVISPYKAMVTLLGHLLTEMVHNEVKLGHHQIADSLSQVAIMTIDSSMGKQRPHILLDTCGVTGHLVELSRTVVACTRAPDSMVIFGQGFCFSSNAIPKDHPLQTVFHRLVSSNRIFRLNESRIRMMNSYTNVLERFS